MMPQSERDQSAETRSLHAARGRAEHHADSTTALAIGTQLRLLVERKRGRQAARRRLLRSDITP